MMCTHSVLSGWILLCMDVIAYSISGVALLSRAGRELVDQ